MNGWLWYCVSIVVAFFVFLIFVDESVEENEKGRHYINSAMILASVIWPLAVLARCIVALVDNIMFEIEERQKTIDKIIHPLLMLNNNYRKNYKRRNTNV